MDNDPFGPPPVVNPFSGLGTIQEDDLQALMLDVATLKSQAIIEDYFNVNSEAINLTPQQANQLY